MNIFVTDENPRVCAENLDDKRVIKMVLESAQILSTAVTLNGGQGMYKPTHTGHPCVQWAAECYENWLWLFNHMMALHNEFKIISGGKTHLSFRKVMDSKLIHEAYKFLDRDKDRTPFVNCAGNKSLGLDYTDMTDVHKAYQLYLNDRWDRDIRRPIWSRNGQRRI